MLAAASSLLSQNPRPVVFDFGAAAGIPFNPVLGTQFLGFNHATGTQHSERPGFVVGPVVGAVLFDRALIEFGAFYRPSRFQADINTPETSSIVSGHGRLWEFPLTANYGSSLNSDQFDFLLVLSFPKK
jgi:hypothetical protein